MLERRPLGDISAAVVESLLLPFSVPSFCLTERAIKCKIGFLLFVCKISSLLSPAIAFLQVFKLRGKW